MSLQTARLTGPLDREQVAAFLDESVIPLRLAVVARSGWPVVVSLWFARDGDAILCATQQSSPLVTALAAEPRCAFEVAGCEPPYRGVRGRARVTVQPDLDLVILRRLVERYLGDAEGRFASWLLGRTTPEVMLRLEPVEVSSWDYRSRMGG
jgi:nitroimidazol reductase NimA-like FMN-containing flavoprotein (pyridoxamine 5'-phosphate oxidase superfamily)